VGTDAGAPAAFIRGLSGAQVEAFAALATCPARAFDLRLMQNFAGKRKCGYVFWWASAHAAA